MKLALSWKNKEGKVKFLKEQEELRKTQIQEDMPTVKLKEEPILEQELEDKISMAKFEEEQKIQEEIKKFR